MKRGIVVSFAVACVVSACKVSGDYGDTRFQCDPGDTCPSGYECIAGFCEVPGPGPGTDAAPGPDARPPSDAGDQPTPPTACGTLGRLFENFSGGTVDTTTWEVWQSGPVSIGHSGGQLVLGYPAGMSDMGGGYFSKRKRHLIRDSRASVEIVEVNNNAPVELNFEIKDLQDNMARIRLYLGTVSFIYQVGSDQLEIGSAPFDAAMHRFWQIREQGGSMYWETSPDGVSWTTHEMRSSEPLAEFGEMQISIWLSQAPANPGRMVVDNLNGGTPSEEPWCATSSISDDFTGTQRSVIWEGWDENPGCTRVLADGVFTADIGDDGEPHGCGLISRTYLNANASAITVEVPQVAAGGPQTYFSLWLTNGDRVEMFHGEGRLYFVKIIAGVRTDMGSLAYDATEHRWWRIRGDNGTAHWEVSPDGRTWTTAVRHDNPLLRLDEVEVALWFFANSANGQSRATSFDNFNLAP